MISDEPFDSLPNSALHRRTMVDCQIRTFDVTDAGVIARFLEVPRERFLPGPLKDLAYSDICLDIRLETANRGSRQLLAPLVLARMIQGASIQPGDHVLDIASGVGYSAAILGGLASTVTTLESDSAYTAQIAENLRACDLSHIQAVTGPLTKGFAKNQPFDVIFINGAVEAELETLFSQLSEGGRLVTIQRFADDPSGHASKAIRFEKVAGHMSSRFLFDASAAVLKEFQKAPQFVF